MEAKVGILTFEQWRSTTDIGSSRIRGSWLAASWPEAELFVIGRRYSTVIFQKSYWLDYAMAFDGVRILDVCDPDFLDWNSGCIAMADRCDAVTASTQALAAMLAKYTRTPCYCIPDRLPADILGTSKRKNHTGNGRARSVAWFGYSANYPSLNAAVPDLLAHGCERLIVISNVETPYVVPQYAVGQIEVSMIEWNCEKLPEYLLQADIVINYKLNYGRWKYKSDNKSALAWAFGLPVAHSACELERLWSEEERVDAAERHLLRVRSDYDIRQSVQEFEAVIASVQKVRSVR